MPAHALRLPGLPAADAQARLQLGAGLDLRLAAPSSATLTLRLAPEPFVRAPGNALETACGRLWLDDAQPLLSRLSQCPAILDPVQPASDDNDWYWPLYNHYLAAELQPLLSPLRAVAAVPDAGIDCLLGLHEDSATALVCRARIPAATLLNLLRGAPWQRLSSHDAAPDWPLRIPLPLGHCTLSAAELASLRTGDVLLAEQPLFTPEGLGHLQLGACRLHLRLLPATDLRFTLTELEDLPMNASLDAFALADSEPLYAASESFDALPDPGRFDDLPLALTLRAGSVSLSLGQLRHLSVGSVLAFSGCAPGQASLFQGERALAHGDLVDIDGRLGLQITRLEPRP
ncbi:MULTISPECIES: FliM/FliN family flagellar motor switch protein [unclassified Pseudomonas]|uniref:FliM/FliN family flagellar motor switch protein n=1 Tax=unclassified Pseudomonas TaxID=196821 RepID=UPI000A1DF098|nr:MULTISPECIES: FliM/FliN family flagellar motor switch protein [unclassified Pseudomonas]